MAPWSNLLWRRVGALKSDLGILGAAAAAELGEQKSLQISFGLSIKLERRRPLCGAWVILRTMRAPRRFGFPGIEPFLLVLKVRLRVQNDESFQVLIASDSLQKSQIIMINFVMSYYNIQA